ncbi:glycerophosphoryl diester phosphodiesterase membrane domain-containing protein [Protaetiibacter larvae]|uniref:Glycerophosphoryl diester phosphodiesterase membrane domain-containing protein n=1 Tax=Protaetiibacter larvae TaxID=2592654 RepID=A0A5C1Y5R2_9MICO|nr:glycerophosphoryl diester phosphodiesterase membrane domain-containing protein [Protaetiibacter larvae]QEO08585.1 hypothetical protein FLP23_00200 [Protaetiibacter larvae]
MTQFAGAFPAPSWTPPAREPFVPLRPLTLGQLLGGAFRALRHNPAVILPPAILLSLISALALVGFQQGIASPLLDSWGSGTGADVGYFWFAVAGIGLLGSLVGQSLGIAVGLVQQAVSALDVSHAVIGRRLTPGGARRRSAGLAPRVLGWAGIALVVLLVVGGLGLALLAVAGVGGPLAAFTAALVVYPGGGVLLAWLGTKLAVVPSVLVVERARLGTALRRSWRLTRGQFWRTFGIRLLCGVMIGIATAIVSIPVALLAQWATSILAGNGDTGDILAMQRLAELAGAVVGSVITGVGLVVTTATDALLYLDLRMRREGLDLELSRFLEQRRGGTRFDPAELDPFRPPADPRSPAAAPAAASVPPAGTGSPWS